MIVSKTPKALLLLLILALAGAVVVTGCGGGGSSSSATATEEAAPGLAVARMFCVLRKACSRCSGVKASRMSCWTKI